jgi:hypothetical protein
LVRAAAPATGTAARGCCCQADPCNCWADEFAHEDADIFGEELAAELAQCALDADALHEVQRRCQEATPPLESRSASESRRLYMGMGRLRREVVTLRGIFSKVECRRLISAAEQAASVRGGWHTSRHADHPTIDMPLRELESSVASFATEQICALVLAPTAVHRGFRPDQLECRDIFVRAVCMHASLCTADSTCPRG